MSLVASRIGLTRDEQADVTTPRPSARFGGLALIPLALLLLVGLIIDSLSLATGSLGFGLAVSSAESLSIAYRNEVWLHGGVLLYAYRAGVRPTWAVLYAAAASGAAVASLAAAA